MKFPTIDPGRLEALRQVCGRETAALSALTMAMRPDQEMSQGLRREIHDLNRRLGSERGVHERILTKTREKADADRRIEARATEIEVQRERVHAANRLRARCEAFMRTGDRQAVA